MRLRRIWPSRGTRLCEIHAVGRSFDLGLDDEAAANDIDDMAEIGVAADGKVGTGKVARGAFAGLVIVEVVAGKMEDAAVFEFEEVVRTFAVELLDTKSAVGTEVGGQEKAALSRSSAKSFSIGWRGKRG